MLNIPQQTVLSEKDRKTLEDARRWIRTIWLRSYADGIASLDGIEQDAVYELMLELDALWARCGTEPQLSA